MKISSNAPGTIWQDRGRTIAAVQVGDLVACADDVNGQPESIYFSPPVSLCHDGERFYFSIDVDGYTITSKERRDGKS